MSDKKKVKKLKVKKKKRNQEGAAKSTTTSSTVELEDERHQKAAAADVDDDIPQTLPSHPIDTDQQPRQAQASFWGSMFTSKQQPPLSVDSVDNNRLLLQAPKEATAISYHTYIIAFAIMYLTYITFFRAIPASRPPPAPLADGKKRRKGNKGNNLIEEAGTWRLEASKSMPPSSSSKGKGLKKRMSSRTPASPTTTTTSKVFIPSDDPPQPSTPIKSSSLQRQPSNNMDDDNITGTFPYLFFSPNRSKTRLDDDGGSSSYSDDDQTNDNGGYHPFVESHRAEDRVHDDSISVSTSPSFIDPPPSSSSSSHVLVNRSPYSSSKLMRSNLLCLMPVKRQAECVDILTRIWVLACHIGETKKKADEKDEEDRKLSVRKRRNSKKEKVASTALYVDQVARLHLLMITTFEFFKNDVTHVGMPLPRSTAFEDDTTNDQQSSSSGDGATSNTNASKLGQALKDSSRERIVLNGTEIR
jgi:hypothetical protein